MTSPSIAGFDIDRFHKPPHDDLTCAICCGVLNDPKQTPCGHLFCHHCITTLFGTLNTDRENKSKRCPLCSQTLTAIQLIKPPLIVINMIKSLGIKCSFAARGCDSLNNALTVDTVTKHEKECEHGPAQCAHEGCSFAQQGSIKRIEVVPHEVQCEWRLVECPNNCGERVPAKNVKQHIDSESITGCTHKMMLCSAGCGQDVRQRDMQQHQHSECSKTLIGCCVEGCEFRAERGSHNVWDDHNQTNVTAHLGLAILAIKQQHEEIKQQQNQITQLSSTVSAQQQIICSLQAAYTSQLANSPSTSVSLCGVQVPPRSVDWVATRITSRWNTGFAEYSGELIFNHIPNASLRYSFKIRVCVNCGEQCQGNVGVFFVPVRGPNHTSLQWPINNHIKLEVLNVKGGLNKAKLHGNHAAKEFFAKHAPPADNNMVDWGFSQFLTQAEVDSGDFVVNDEMVVRCTLLGATFD